MNEIDEVWLQENSWSVRQKFSDDHRFIKATSVREAAPDLLAACEEASYWLEYFGMMDDEDPKHPSKWLEVGAKLQTAIAKAKGLENDDL